MTPEERAEDVLQHYTHIGGALYNLRFLSQLIVDAVAAAIDAEREACAKAAEATGTWVHDKPYEVQVDMRARIAAAIRARKD